MDIIQQSELVVNTGLKHLKDKAISLPCMQSNVNVRLAMGLVSLSA